MNQISDTCAQSSDESGLGNELRWAKEANAKLAHALTVLYLEQADYIRVNNLGHVHHNYSMQLARETLLKYVP